jgi:hypothetical protein
MVVGLAQVSLAQQQVFSGLNSFNPGGVNPIYENNEVKGYVMYYRSERADKKNDVYQLDFLDQNLKKVKSIEMLKPKRTYFLLNNSFNGNTFCFYFYNYRANQFELETYDQSLNKVASVVVDDVSKADRAYATRQVQAGQTNTPALVSGLGAYPVGDRGFLRNAYVGLGKSYTLTYYDNKLKKVWHIEGEESKDYETFNITEVTDKYAVGTMIRRPNMMSKKMSSYAVAFDLSNGKKVLDIPIETEQNEQLSLSMIDFDEDKKEFMLIGEFYKLDDKPFVHKSLGMFVKRISVEGKNLGTAFYRWNEDIKSKMPAEAMESIEDKYINYIHEIVKDQNGNMYLITEQYKIVVSGLGIAAQALGGNASAMKGKIANMLIFVINPQGKIQEIKFFDKDVTDVELMPGTGFMGAGILGHMMKGYGNFDYRFTQRDNAATHFNTVFINYRKKENNEIVNVLYDSPQNFKKDKVEIASEKRERKYVYPAKLGYNMVVTYDAKAKDAEMALIKLNN